MERTPSVGGDSASAYLARLRLGARLLLCVRTFLSSLAAAALVFALASWMAGAVASRPAAGLAWALILLASFVGARRGLLPGRDLGGGGVARLLPLGSANLSSSARSAYELADESGRSACSDDLISAHREGVAAALAEIPIWRVLPWRWLLHRDVAVALLLCLSGWLFIQNVDRAAAGSFALMHPDHDLADTHATADIVSSVNAELIPPAHLHLGPTEVNDPITLEAPVGATIRYSIRTRVPGSDAILRVGDREVRLESLSSDSFAGRFVARESAPLTIRLRNAEGIWLEDPARRMLRVEIDEAPRIEITRGDDATMLELEAPVALGYEASDDVGLATLDLVVRLTDGTERRFPLRRFEDDEQDRLHAGEARFVPAELGARPGDSLVAYLEATDGDSISGPNVGRSIEIPLQVASETTRRAEVLEDLAALVDLSVDTLADRLERPPPEAGEHAMTRLRLLTNSTEGLASALTSFADLSRSNGNARAADAPLFTDMARRLRRRQTRESDLLDPPIASTRRRLIADAKMVDELEGDVILLADLLGRSRIEDAAALARELEQLRREMVSLLAEVRRTGDPEARRALMEALARARQRMGELISRIQAMGTEVPSEFVNAGAMDDAPADDALRSLAEAVEREDLDAAERYMIELRRQLDGLAGLLGHAEAGFAEAHFGPRDRAFAEAMDALTGLEAEQRRLASRSEELRRAAARRAIESLEEGSDRRGEALEQKARLASDALQQIPRAGIGAIEADALDRARERLEDAADALSTGDLGEARTMASEASMDLEGLARDLELSALMFPGRRGELAVAARAAGAATEHLRELRTQMDRSLPQLERHLSEPERRRLRGDADRQSQVIEAATGIAQRFSESPDGSPLASEAGEVIENARASMVEAERALRQTDSVGASRAQDEAARKLTELREELEQERTPGGGGGGASGENRASPQERVEIPTGGAGHAPIELRRRLLDARRSDVPESYLEAAERYYEELLR